MTATAEADPRLDLVLDRLIDVPPQLVWDAWTKPEHVKHWFVPKPWTISDCEIDLRPGGKFKVVMRSPDGAEFPYTGCYLEIIPGERLIWTNVLLPEFRPAPSFEGPHFTAVFTIKPEGAGGTRYNATLLHRNDQERAGHEAMGFHQGWSTAVDQLIEYVKNW